MDSYGSLEQYKQEQCIKLFNTLLSHSRQGIEFMLAFEEVMNVAKHDDIYLDFLDYLQTPNARTGLKKIDELQINFANIVENRDLLTNENLINLSQILKLGIKTEGLDTNRDFDFLTSVFSEQEIRDFEYKFVTRNISNGEQLKKLLDSKYIDLLSEDTLGYYEIDNEKKREIIKKSINITEEDLKKYKEEYEDTIEDTINELSGSTLAQMTNRNPKGLTPAELIKYHNIVKEIKSIQRLYPEAPEQDIFQAYLYGDGDKLKEHPKAKYDIPFLFTDEIEEIRKIMLLQFDEGENIGTNIKQLKLNKIKKIAISKILFQMKNNQEASSMKIDAILAIKRVLSLKTINVNKDLLELIASKTNISDIDAIFSSNKDLLQDKKGIIPKKNNIITTKDLLMFTQSSEEASNSVEETDFEKILKEIDNYDVVNIVPAIGANGKQVLKKTSSYNDPETGENKNECIIALNLNDPTIRKRFFDEISLNKKIRDKIISPDKSIMDFCRAIKDSEFYRYQINDSKDIYKKLFLLKSQSSVRSFKKIGRNLGSDPKEENTLNRLNFSNYTLSCDGVRQILEIASLSNDNFYEFEFDVKDIENLPNLLLEFYEFKRKNKGAKLPSNFRLHIKSSSQLSTSQKKRVKDFFNQCKENIGNWFGIDKIIIENESLSKIQFRKNSFVYNEIKQKKAQQIENRISRIFTKQDTFSSISGNIEKQQNIFETKEVFKKQIEDFKELDVDKAIESAKIRKLDEATTKKFAANLEDGEEDNDIENQLEQELEMDEEQQLEMNLLYNLSKKPEKNKDIPEKSIIEERNCYTKIQEILDDPNCAEEIKSYLKTVLTRYGGSKINEQECRDFFLKITATTSTISRNKTMKRLGGKLANKALTKEAFIQCVKNIIKFGNPRLNIIGKDPFFETFETEKGVIVVDTNANSLLEKKPHPVFTMLSTYPVFTENTDKASNYQQAISKIRERYGDKLSSEVAENIQSIFEMLPDFASKEQILMQRPAIINPDTLVYISRCKGVFSSFVSEIKGNVANSKLGKQNLQKIYEKIFINIMSNFGKDKPQRYGTQIEIYDVPDLVKICNGCRYIFRFLNRSINEGILDAEAVAFMLEKNQNIFKDGEQSAGIFYTTLLKTKYRAQAEVIRQRMIAGENVGDIDINNPEEVAKYLFKNPLSPKEKKIVKTSIEYSLMTMSHPRANLDALTLAKQEFTEICTAEDVNTTTVGLQNEDDIDKKNYKIIRTNLPTKNATGGATLATNHKPIINGIEYDFMTFLFQERERWFDGRLKENGLNDYERFLINKRNEIISYGLKIMRNKDLGLEYKKAFYNILINGGGNGKKMDDDFIAKLEKEIEKISSTNIKLIQNTDLPADKLLKIIPKIEAPFSRAKTFLETLSEIKQAIGDNNFKIIENYVDYDFDTPNNYSLQFMQAINSLLNETTNKGNLKKPIFGKLLATIIARTKKEDLNATHAQANAEHNVARLLPNPQSLDQIFIEQIKRSHLQEILAFSNGLSNTNDIQITKNFLSSNYVKEKLEEFTIEKTLSERSDYAYVSDLLSNRPSKNICEKIIAKSVAGIAENDKKTLSNILVSKNNFDNEYRFFNSDINLKTRQTMSELFQKIILEAYPNHDSLEKEIKKYIVHINRICVQYEEDAVALTRALKKIYDKSQEPGATNELLNVKHFLEIIDNMCQDNAIKGNKKKIDIEELANTFLNNDIITAFFEKDETRPLEEAKKVSVGRIQDCINNIVNSTFLNKNQKNKLLRKIAKINSIREDISEENGISAIEKNLGITLQILEELDGDIKRQKNALIDHNFLINVFSNCIDEALLNIEKANNKAERVNIANSFKEDMLFGIAYIKNLNAILKEARFEGNQENITNVSNFITQFKQTLLENGYLIKDVRQILQQIPAQEISNKLGTRALKYLSKIDKEDISDKVFEEITQIEKILGEDILSTNYSHSELLKLIKKKENAENLKRNAKYSIEAHERQFLTQECQKLDGLDTNRELFEKIEKANKQFSRDIINIYDETKNIAKDIEKLSKKYDSNSYLPDSTIFNTSGLNLIKAIDDTVFDIKTSDVEKRKLKRQLQYVYCMAGLLLQDEDELNILSEKLDSKIKQATEEEENEEEVEENDEENKEKKDKGLTEKEQLQLYACYLAKYKKKNNILLRPEQLGPSILAKNDRKIVIRMKTGTGKTKTIDFTAFNSLKEGKTPVIIAPNEVLVEQHLADLKQCPDIEEKNIYIVTKTSIYRANTKEEITDDKQIKEIIENKNMCNVLLSTANDLDFFRKKKLQSKEGIEFLTIMKEKGVLLQDEIDSSVDPFSSNKNAKPSEVMGFKEYDLAEFYFNARGGVNETNAYYTKDQIADKFFKLSSADTDEMKKKLEECKSVFEYLKIRIDIDIEDLLQQTNDPAKTINDVLNERQKETIMNILEELDKDYENAISMQQDKNYAIAYYTKNNKTYADYRIIINDKITDKSNRFSRFVNYFVRKKIEKEGNNVEKVMANVMTDSSVALHLHKYFNKVVGFTATPKDNDIWISNNFKVRGFESVNVDNRKDEFKQSTLIEDDEKKDGKITTKSKAILFANMLFMALQNKGVKSEDIVSNTEGILNQIKNQPAGQNKEIKQIATLLLEHEERLLKDLSINKIPTYHLSFFEGTKKVKSIAEEMGKYLDETFTIINPSEFANIEKPEIFALESSEGEITMQTIKNKVKKNPKNLFIFGTMEYGVGCDFPNEPRILNFETHLTKEKQYQIFGRTGRSGRYGNVVSYPEYSYDHFLNLIRHLYRQNLRNKITDNALKTWIAANKTKIDEILTKTDENERKNKIEDLFGTITRPISEEIFQANLEFNSLKEMMQWKKHETIENLKEEFSDKINIAISIINKDEEIPFDLKGRLVKEIEFESSKYLNYVLDPYLKNALDNSTSLKEFDNKNAETIDTVRKNIDAKIENILCQKCIISYSDKEKPKRKAEQYISNILKTINKTFNQLRTDVINEREETIQNGALSDEQSKEVAINDRLDYNRKAFLKTYIEEKDTEGKKIQRKYSLQRITTDNNNSTKIMLSAIGNVIECGMKIKPFGNFHQTNNNNFLMLGIQKLEKTQQNIEGNKSNSELTRDIEKTQDNDYVAINFKNRAVIASKKILNDDGKEIKKNIVILSANDSNLSSDLSLLYTYAKTQDPETTYIIQHKNGVLSLNQEQLEQIVVRKKPISKFDKDYTDFINAFPDEMKADSDDCNKKLTKERAKTMYTKYLIEGIMSEDNISREKRTPPAKKLENDFVERFKKQSYREENGKKDFIIESLIDDKINASVLSAFSRMYGKEDEFFQKFSYEINQVNRCLDGLRKAKKHPSEQYTPYTTPNTSSLSIDNDTTFAQFREDRNKKLNDLKIKLNDHKSHFFSIPDEYIAQIKTNDMTLSEAVQKYATELTKQIENLEQEIEDAEIFFEDKNKLKKTLEDIKDLDKMDDKMDKYRKLITEAIKLDNLILTTKEMPEGLDLSNRLDNNEEWFKYEDVVNLDNLDEIKEKLEQLKDSFTHKDKVNGYIVAKLYNNGQEMKLRQIYQDKYNNATKNIALLNNIVKEITDRKNYIDATLQGIEEKFITIFEETDAKNTPQFFEENLHKLTELYDAIDKDIDNTGVASELPEEERRADIINQSEIDTKKLSPYHQNMLRKYLDDKIPDIITKMVSENHHLLFNGFSLEGLMDENGNLTEKTLQALEESDFSEQEIYVFDKIIDAVCETIKEEPINDGKTFNINEEENKQLFEKIKQLYTDAGLLDLNNLQPTLTFHNKMVNFLFQRIQKQQKERERITNKLQSDKEFSAFNGKGLFKKIEKNITNGLEGEELERRYENLTNKDLADISTQNNEDINKKIENDKKILEAEKEKSKITPLPIRVFLAIFPGCLIIPWFFKEFRDKVLGEDTKPNNQEQHTPIVNPEKMEQHATNILQTQQAQNLNKQINNSKFIKYQLEQNNKQNTPPQNRA